MESNDDKLSEKEICDHETDDHHDGLRRRSDAGLGGADEDRRGGFERGGWVGPLFDNEANAVLNQVYQRADAFLFGRRTYEIFAGSWGVMPDLASHPIGAALNTQPKYVASDHAHRTAVGEHDRPLR